MTSTSNHTLVSVVLPTYNRAYILPKAIESIRAQTYTHWELIVVDDGSTDNTEDIVASFADPRIRYVKHDRNKGLAAGRNTGIQEARGEFIANLDSDDTWLPTKLEKELHRFHPGIDVVYSAYDRTLADGRTLHLPVDPKEENLQNNFLESNVIGMVMATVRGDVFLKYGMFDESIEALQDWELWLRIAPHCKFAYVPEVLTVGSVLEDSISSDHMKRLRSREKIFNKHELLFRRVPSAYARHAYSIGHTYALRGETAHGFVYLKKALRARPFIPRYVAASALAWVSIIAGKPDMYKRIAAR